MRNTAAKLTFVILNINVTFIILNINVIFINKSHGDAKRRRVT